MSTHTPDKTRDWNIVYRTVGLLPAEAVQGRLATAGIPAVLEYDNMQPLLGIPAFAGTGEVRVLVPLDRLTEARDLLGPDSEPEDDND
jgi:hypothetical protein